MNRCATRPARCAAPTCARNASRRPDPPTDHPPTLGDPMPDVPTSELPASGLQLRSLVTAAGQLELSLVDVDVPAPRDDQVVVRIDAAPINPSDLGLLFGGADMSAATTSGTADRPVVTAPIAPAV